MALYLEFVVPGPPVSNQQRTAPGRASLRAWNATIRGAAQGLWPNPILTGELKAVIINFFTGPHPSLDVDNMSKPILDAMQRVVYENDRQIRQAELAHLWIGAAFSIAGASMVVVSAIQAGSPFVYVRIEDPADPYPLPK